MGTGDCNGFTRSIGTGSALERLESFQGRCRNDDETLLVLQRERASLVASLGEVAVNHSVRRQDDLEVGDAADGLGRCPNPV